MTLFSRTKRLSDLWRLTFFRKSTFEKSKDCQSRNVPETCSSSSRINEDDDTCPPCPSFREDSPPPCPKQPTWPCPDTSNVGNFHILGIFRTFLHISNFCDKFLYSWNIVNLMVPQDLDAMRCEWWFNIKMENKDRR